MLCHVFAITYHNYEIIDYSVLINSLSILFFTAYKHMFMYLLLIASDYTLHNAVGSSKYNCVVGMFIL